MGSPSSSRPAITTPPKHAGVAVAGVSEIKLLPGTPAVESQIGRDGIVIDRLPFRVGRRAVAGEPPSKTQAELLLLT